jgi:hypothetical protein
VQPEVDEHGGGGRAQSSHDGARSVPDALGPEDLERLELDRMDPLLVAAAEARLELRKAQARPTRIAGRTTVAAAA